MLSSLGRSGSTWLMKMFAAHPEIVTMRRFPYESSAGKYWMHAMKVLSDPANLELSAHLDTFHSDRWWAGSNPYFDAPAIDDPERGAWLGREHVERLARFFQETVEQWYLTVARSQGQEAPRYFAEKHLWPNFLPMLIRELYPGAREVFLVRDFRDVACSALAADARRGYAGFGREPHMSEEEYVRDVVRRMATDLQRSWEARARRGAPGPLRGHGAAAAGDAHVAARVPGRGGLTGGDRRPRAGAGVRRTCRICRDRPRIPSSSSGTATTARRKVPSGAGGSATRDFARSSTRRSARR